MPGQAVHLDRAPHCVFLIAWGRGEYGWWGCIRFRVHVETPNGPAELGVAAWVPATSLSRPGWSSSAPELPRFVLPAERMSWPAPIGWPLWWAGVWPNGPLALPDGVRLCDGPAWKRR